MWDLPRPGMEPLTPALAGWIVTTRPLGKSHISLPKEQGGIRCENSMIYEKGKKLSSYFWSVREELQERDFLRIISMHLTGVGYSSWIPSLCPQGRLFQKGEGFHVGSFIYLFCSSFLILISIWDQFWKFQSINLSWGSNFNILLDSLDDQSGWRTTGHKSPRNVWIYQ